MAVQHLARINVGKTPYIEIVRIDAETLEIRSCSVKTEHVAILKGMIPELISKLESVQRQLTK
jgi:hypothetical protein